MADYVIPRDEWAVFYRQSANKRTAIEVLRDVTLLPRKEIEDALIAVGCEVKKRKATPHENRFDRERALQLYRQGKSDKEIAQEVRVHHTTVYLWRRSSGLPFNGARKPPTRIDEKETMRLYMAGLMDYEIAEKIKSSAPTVCRWRKRNGLPSNYDQKVVRSGRAAASD